MKYNVGDVRMESAIKDGKTVYTTYSVCTAVHTNTNPQLCGGMWSVYSATTAPEEVRNAVKVRIYHFVYVKPYTEYINPITGGENMTQFKKNLNRLLKEEAIADIVDRYERGMITFDEAIISISERKCLEADVFSAITGDRFVMSGMTEDDVRHRVQAASTEMLQSYMDWYLNGRRAMP